MAVTKIKKISSWTLVASIVITLVVLVLFFTGGAVDPAAELEEPVYTETLMNWVATLFGATILCTILFALWQFISLLKTNAKEALVSIASIILFVAILGITYAMGDGTPLQGLNADSQAYNTESWLKITDMWIMTMITLLVLIVACAIWGSVKKAIGK